MPAIAMCQSETCPSRAACFRNEESGTKSAPLVQAYAEFVWDADTGRCENFVSAVRHWMHQAPLPEDTTAETTNGYQAEDDPAVQPVSDEERHAG